MSTDLYRSVAVIVARKYRIAVDEERVKKWMKGTPDRKKGGIRLFRTLNEQGMAREALTLN